MARRLESVGHHSIVDLKARQFARVLASRSDLVDWDSQGRIRIKDELLDYAGIKGSVTMVGNFRFFELWNPDLLKKSGVLDETDMVEAVRHVGF
jgi:DNA-binding transcriptional regulator/RsmH inhibitor MraZ